MSTASIFKSVSLTVLTILALIFLAQCGGGDKSTGGGGSITPPPGAELIADHAVLSTFDQIPDSIFRQIRSEFRIFYGHTSHGSQIVTGMHMLYEQDTILSLNDGAGTLAISEYSDDLGYSGDTSWAPITRQYLSQNPATNIVVWSWCAGCSDNTPAGIDAYLAAMTRLEYDYPDVSFIYMTGHLDGTGVNGTLYTCNNQIRAFCRDHERVLFDFADIESYDPAGNYYPNGTDACEWCADWCASHDCPPCLECAHSHCFNCYQKGKAFWWLLARLSGWSPS